MLAFGAPFFVLLCYATRFVPERFAAFALPWKPTAQKGEKMKKR